ncbi:Aminotransferase DegT [Tenacibaculum sp. 190524A05c]|uniref:DegT/DnrJ/EryC1/StrS family aminotransferase n=1 Tax=Tenacibaculum platacis TaxID=3137852 RepID=UPI0031FAEB20
MIPIFKPYMPENISEEIQGILYSGKLSYGTYGRKFEDELKKFTGNEYVLSISTYNQALLVALSALDIKPKDEIIASPVSCLASNQPFISKGAKVIWADIDPTTGSMSVEDVKRKITTRTKAIFHNHYCGYLGNINEINDLGKEYGIPVVDDSIEAFGSVFNGKKVGNLGTDITVFSFQTVRLPNTIDGAALTFKDPKLYEKAKKIRDYGIDRTKFRDDLNEINPECDISLEGYGALMNEINSFIGFKQMDDVDKLIAKQRENASKWDSIVNDIENCVPLKVNKDTNPNYWVYGVLANNKREQIKSFRNKGFYATSVHINNNIYSVFKNKSNLKGVNEFMNKFIAIPSGWWTNIEL